MWRSVFLLSIISLELLGCSTKKEAPKQLSSISSKPKMRSVDFRNFDYPAIPGEMDVAIQLRNGEHKMIWDEKEGGAPDLPKNAGATLDQVLYNYDERGQPMAVVVVGIWTGGSMYVSEIFLYRLVEQAPQLVWSFETGDRADGGLRAIYFESGRDNMVLELYQQGSNDPLCCASHYSRHLYNWKNNEFVEFSREDWLPVPKASRTKSP
jgi:hypothetical protein